MIILESITNCHTKALLPCHTERSEVTYNTESSLDLPLETLFLQPFLQSLHKEQWQEVRLGEVAEIIGGGTPKTSIPEYWNGEIPWLTPKDLAGYNHIYISKGERFITKMGLKNFNVKRDNFTKFESAYRLCCNSTK